MKIALRTFLILALVVSVAGTFDAPVVHAASDLGPTQCASKKTVCNKKKGGGGGGGQAAQNTTTPAQSAACAGFNQIGSGVNCDQSNGGTGGQTQVGNTVNTVVGLLSYVAGILGIIFIVLSGFKYITSSGDQNKVASAKTTLIYALAGLAVAALAQILIHTVLSTASGI